MRRQIEREQEENIRHQLDQDFNSLRSLLYAPDPSSTGSNSIPIGRNRENGPQSSTATAAPEKENLDYDMHVRELAFDKRAQPKDRTKTEEELAFEEKEALEKAERNRRRRMLGEEDASDEGDLNGKGRGKRKRERGGDDLDDDFQDEEEWGGLGPGLGAGRIADDGAEEEDGGIKEEGQSDGESSDEEDSGSASSDEEDDDSESNSEAEEGGQRDLTTTRKPVGEPRKSGELPFTFPCPETHEQFLEIIEQVADSDVPTVVKRIRALHHPSLAPENKIKLQVCFYIFVLVHVADSSS